MYIIVVDNKVIEYNSLTIRLLRTLLVWWDYISQHHTSIILHDYKIYVTLKQRILNCYRSAGLCCCPLHI